MNENYRATILVLISFALIFIMSTSGYGQTDKGINFLKPKNWEEVLSMAKKQHKSIFVDIYTTWCGPCKAMDQNIYPDTILGTMYNEDFISIKIQMDSTKNDDSHIRSWYGEAARIRITAKVQAFPTLLFYSPTGDLLIKAIGYKDIPAMTTLAKFAGNTDLAAQLSTDLQEYKSGKRDYQKMIALSRFAKQILQDDKLALQIAKDYKTGYLDKIDMTQFFTRENIEFIREYVIELVDINDKFFKLCYEDPEKIDAILGEGTAEQYVPIVVARDDLKSRLYKNEKPIVKNPNWDGIKNTIKTRYPKIDVDNFMLNQKIAYYGKTKQWDLYTFYMSYKIKINPPKPGTLDVFFNLNDPAWNVFEKSNDKIALQRALTWSELSIKLEDNVQYLDTKANLLYKLGRVTEALKVEKIAVDKLEELYNKTGKRQFPEIIETYEKMLKGKITWPKN